MTTRRPLRIAALAAAVGLTVAACGGSDSADDNAAPPADTATEADADADADGDPTVNSGDADAGSTDAVPALLQFSAPLVGGGELDAAELSSKPTAFWFWSPT